MASDLAGGEDGPDPQLAVRTRLDQIAGYGEVLRQEAADLRDAELSVIFDRLEGAARRLRDVASGDFWETAAGDWPKEPSVGPESGVQELLRDIVTLAQGAKNRANGELGQRFLPGAERIIEAASSILGLLGAGSATPVIEEEFLPPGMLPARLESVDLGHAPRSGRILIVDESKSSRAILARHLERQGHVVCQAEDGRVALDILRQAPFDLLVIDVMMPTMNGYQLLETVKADPRLSSVYVIVISSLDDTRSIARCIQLGAEDYLPREFEPVILRARIESCLEKRALKAQEELYVAAVREVERDLFAGLSEGAEYVRRLLPPRLDGPSLRSDWVFIPSRSLGGDVFGYHWLESGRLALYLLDASGHGIGAALYSVTIMNILKTQSLAGTDFGNPASVLAHLNAAFQMEGQNNLFLTAWYGVWDAGSRALSYASAGSHPAILIQPGGGTEHLATASIAVGLDPASEYRTAETRIAPGSRLYLFSDGAFEIPTGEGGMLGLDGLVDILRATRVDAGSSFLKDLVGNLRRLSDQDRFLDDVSMVEFSFG